MLCGIRKGGERKKKPVGVLGRGSRFRNGVKVGETGIMEIIGCHITYWGLKD